MTRDQLEGARLYVREAKHIIPEMALRWLDEIERLCEAQELASLQAEDELLWFRAEHITESYLQGELRKLHAAIEGKR